MADKNQVIDRSFFWKNIIRAVEAEPHELTSIRGASGFHHSAIAVGVDDARRRLIIISDELDARSAAMVQSDIQANMQSVQIIMARPIAVNLSDLANVVSGLAGMSSINAN